jgi:exopolyphosphatase/guanosine-5'-triphosphate,3'-diphosphate pyrophosphatase
MTSAAVIDIGSNSIKILVAGKDEGGRLVARQIRTIEARISAGISRENPRLAPEGAARGIRAVAELVTEAHAFRAGRIIVVATSAVRDAANGREFCDRIRSETGQPVRILTGEEEANLIARGLLCDPALEALRDFYVFDLGGGSLECLDFRDRKVAQAASLQLGCVRLTEMLVADPALPFTAGELIAARVGTTVAAAGFSLAHGGAAVGTGGTLTTARAVLGARAGRTLEKTDPRITVGQLRGMLSQVGGLALADRRKVAGLPPARADIFPAALSILVALAELGGFYAYQHSLYNLRWGVAAEALESGGGAF